MTQDVAFSLGWNSTSRTRRLPVEACPLAPIVARRTGMLGTDLTVCDCDFIMVSRYDPFSRR
jgi:hypothetical protein